ncbi:MAG: hypothetical protein HY331_14725 [Chloroflexi bacterium]|nr:hypothetical protein [Chloroflexota bacterium]
METVLAIVLFVLVVKTLVLFGWRSLWAIGFSLLLTLALFPTAAQFFKALLLAI